MAETTSPVPTGPATEATPNPPARRRVFLEVEDMTCASCSSRVERALNKLPDVRSSVNLAAGRATIDAPTTLDDAALAAVVSGRGYPARVATATSAAPVGSAELARARSLWKRFVVALLLFIPLSNLAVVAALAPAARFPGWQWLLLAPVPAGGHLVTGAMTGESVVRELTVGDQVSAGFLVVDGRIVVRTMAVGADTQLAGMIRLVEQAQVAKCATQRLVDRVSAVFVPTVLILPAVTTAGWWLLGAAPGAAISAGLGAATTVKMPPKISVEMITPGQPRGFAPQQAQFQRRDRAGPIRRQPPGETGERVTAAPRADRRTVLGEHRSGDDLGPEPHPAPRR